MAQQKDIREKVLWVIQSNENQKGGGGTDLRVIQWVIDGKPSKPMLEKRDWYLTEEGDRKAGKAKGMAAGDLYLIIKNIKAIAKLLEVKPQHLDEALQLAMFQDDVEKGKAKADTKVPDDFRQAPAGAREPVTAGTGIPDQQF